MSYHHLPLIDETALANARRELSGAFSRLLGYFQQDGMSSVSLIETAMHGRDPAAMVTPAHRLKGESRQFGASRLSSLAEHLEMTARRHIEDRLSLPDALSEDVRGLRALFQHSVAQLEERSAVEETATARPRIAAVAGQRPVFGRRAS